VRVKVRYQGAFADAAHAREAVYEFASATVDSLIDYLLQRNEERFRFLMLDPFTGKMRSGTTILVNGQRMDLYHVLHDNDTVTLLTPLAGG
jgi:molybdopterin converting factor small subunit